MSRPPARLVALALVGVIASGCATAPAATPTQRQRLTTTPAPATPKAAAEMILDVAVSDRTNNDKPDLEIWVRGHGSWYPDLEFGGDLKHLGTFSVGDANEFFIYPDGRDGKEIRVVFEMQPDMISGSDMSRTRVEVHDKRVKVWGQAIPDFEATYSR